MSKKIRFIDTEYHTLFYLLDGDNIVLTHSNGKKYIRNCRYIDEYHVKVENNIFHICEFAQIMEHNKIHFAPEKSIELPQICFAVLPSCGELVMLKKNEEGYYKCPYSAPDRETNEKEATRCNSHLEVTKQQEQAMLFGSMFGWDKPGAKTEFYDFYGKPVIERATEKVQ